MKRQTDSYQDVRYALNRSVTDLLFFISVGNLRRVKEIVEYERLNLGSDRLVDYDMRTPLHMAASIGSAAIVEFLLQNGALRVINVLDAMNHTPLDEAIRGNHADAALLLYEAVSSPMPYVYTESRPLVTVATLRARAMLLPSYSSTRLYAVLRVPC